MPKMRIPNAGVKNIAAITIDNSTDLAEEIKRGGRTIELVPRTYDLRNLTIGRSNTEFVSTDETKIPILLMSARHPGGPMLQSYGLDEILFNGVCLDGNFANQPGATRGSSSLVLAWLRNGEDIKMQNCIVRNSAIDALKLTACDNILVEGNRVHDLGHEFVYLMYDCEGAVIRDNRVKTRTNSAFRISYGGHDIKIHDNTICSEIASWSTGPGIEMDKRLFSDVEIFNNTISNLNGSGIWFSADVANCSNVNIHHNTFDNVGNYLNGVTKYNGYSNGGIAGSGMNGVRIEDNTFKNLVYGIIMSEAKHEVPGAYTWILKRNKFVNVKTGFRIDESNAFIEGQGNDISGIKTLTYGFGKNVSLKSNTEPIENNDPIVITPTPAEVIRAILKVTDAMGKTGMQTFDLETSKVDAGTSDKVTVKLSTDGKYGSRTYTLPLKANVQPAGLDLLVELTTIRDGISSENSFILPAVTGSGLNEFKFRTADGKYATGIPNIALIPKEIPQTGGKLMKSMKFTVIGKTPKGELVHQTATGLSPTPQIVDGGDEFDATVKFLTDTGLTGTMTGKVKLIK